MTLVHLPGLIDVHVHLREPGGEHKEDLSSGTAAALAGGVTTVLDMPNTYPPLVDAHTLDHKLALIGRKALCDVGLYAGATEVNAIQVAAIARKTIGLKIYLDQTYGPLRMHNLPALLTHFQNWPDNRPIAVHAEGLSMAMAIGLARIFGKRLHLCHISRADEIALIRAAKASGVRLSCEVTPHHLFLTEKDAQRLGPYGSMKPPLASEADRIALWRNLDLIDCIATDHAPHTHAEKMGNDPPPGIPGLETMLPLLWTAVTERRITEKRLVELTYDHPKRIFNLPTQPETWVELDPKAQVVVSRDNLHTKCHWTPFEGMRVWGQVRRVVLRGQTVLEEGQVRAEPGIGRAIQPE